MKQLEILNQRRKYFLDNGFHSCLNRTVSEVFKELAATFDDMFSYEKGGGLGVY